MDTGGNIKGTRTHAIQLATGVKKNMKWDKRGTYISYAFIY